MKYIYQSLRLPKNFELFDHFEKASLRLKNKFKKFNIGKLEILDYNKSYLNNYLAEIDKVLQRFNYLLALAAGSRNLDQLKKMTLVEDGGGLGFISLLARESGWGRVIYHDIDENQTNDAKIIAQELNLQADLYLTGGIQELKSELEARKINIDSLISNDVIEHVYNIQKYLRVIACLSDSSFNLVMASGANSANPRVRRDLSLKQSKIELEGTDSNAENPRDCYRSFIEVRRELIKNKFPQISSQELKKLAILTRGMNKKDIEKSAKKYLETGRLPTPLRHPTNTCDPYTGNWCEHLMDPKRLKKILMSYGFKTTVLPGYLNQNQNSLYKKTLYKSINISLNFLGEKGLFLSPYYVLYAEKEKIQKKSYL